MKTESIPIKTIRVGTHDVSKWFCKIGRPVEECVFGNDDRCVWCGRKWVDGMRQVHPGKVRTLDGWFVLDEYLEPEAVDLPLTIPGSPLENVPIIVTVCELMDGGEWKYTFHAEGRA